MRSYLIASALLLSGCGIAHNAHMAEIAEMSTAQLRTVSDDELGQTVRAKGCDTEVVMELVRRNIITSGEVDPVCNRQIQIGMSEHALILAKGMPTATSRVVTVEGERVQWIFQNSRYDIDYVYLNNGIVTAWQD